MPGRRVNPAAVPSCITLRRLNLVSIIVDLHF
jgi:hypothetical protein